MKKFIGTLMAIMIIVVPSSQIFANEQVMDSEAMRKASIVFSTDEERASISGNFGTAYIGSFAGTILVTTTSGLPVKTYYVSGGEMSPIDQVSVSSLKKGTYRAIFGGNGVTVSGKKFNILPGLSETFTKY